MTAGDGAGTLARMASKKKAAVSRRRCMHDAAVDTRTELIAALSTLERRFYRTFSHVPWTVDHVPERLNWFPEKANPAPQLADYVPKAEDEDTIKHKGQIRNATRILRAVEWAMRDKNDKLLDRLCKIARPYLQAHTKLLPNGDIATRSGDVVANRIYLAATALRSKVVWVLSSNCSNAEVARFIVNVLCDYPAEVHLLLEDLDLAGASNKVDLNDRVRAAGLVAKAIDKCTTSSKVRKRPRTLSEIQTNAENIVRAAMRALGYPAETAKTMFQHTGSPTQ